MIAFQSRGRASASIVVATLLLSFASQTAGAGAYWLPVGLCFESNFYTQFGIQASFAHDLLLRRHPHIGVSYTTSRLSALTGRNVLVKDNFVVSARWHFRPGRLVDPHAGIDAGFTRFNREDDELFALIDNRAPMFNVRAGMASSPLGGRIRASIDGGFALVQSSTEFPLFFGVAIGYDIAQGVLP